MIWWQIKFKKQEKVLQCLGERDYYGLTVSLPHFILKTDPQFDGIKRWGFGK